MSESEIYSSDKEDNEARQCLSSSDLDDTSCIPRKRTISQVCYNSRSSDSSEDDSSVCRSSDGDANENDRMLIKTPRKKKL